MSQEQVITLPMICREAGISQETARRYFADFKPSRNSGQWHRFTPEEKEEALAHIASKRQRRCRNKYNSAPL